MAKSARQLDVEIAEALRDQEMAQAWRELAKLPIETQARVTRAQEIGALGDEIKAAGLHLTFPKRMIAARGNTYPVRGVLKRHGFRFNAGDKSWQRPTAHAEDDIDYLIFYRDLLAAL